MPVPREIRAEEIKYIFHLLVFFFNTLHFFVEIRNMPIKVTYACFFSILISSINNDKKKSIATCNRAINKLVPPYDDNQKIPRNDIALLRRACVGEGLLYRKSTPCGPA